MGKISLSWNNLIMALVFTSTTLLGEVRCPSYQSGHPLTMVDLFDGPPEELANLMADVSRGTSAHGYAKWEVEYVFKAHRNLFLRCTYDGTGEPGNMIIKVEKKVGQCIFRDGENRLG